MVEEKLQGLTQDETELYDRQIRLWGYEAQWKLKSARIYVIGMDGLGAEIVKNIVLSGVKSVVMWDDKLASEDDFENQFFIPRTSLNINRAEASKAKVQALNPLVLISCDNEDLSKKSDEFFKDFELVLSCNQKMPLNIKLDEICRKHNTPFYAAGVYGTFSYAFFDLQDHKYSNELNTPQLIGNKTEICMETLKFPSLQEVLTCEVKTPELSKFVRKSPASVILFKVINKFEEDFHRRPTDTEDDYQALLKLRASISEGFPLKDSFPIEILRAVAGMPNPTCAVMGAIIAQEIIKAVTQKNKPFSNFLFFDPVRCVAHVQYVGPEIKAK